MTVTIQGQHSKKKGSGDGVLLGLGRGMLTPGGAGKAQDGFAMAGGHGLKTALSSPTICTAPGLMLAGGALNACRRLMASPLGVYPKSNLLPSLVRVGTGKPFFWDGQAGIFVNPGHVWWRANHHLERLWKL